MSFHCSKADNLIFFVGNNLDAFGCFDYTTTMSSVTFAAGSSAGASMSINIPINDDICVEQLLEGFMVQASFTDPDVSFPSGSSATVRITDNDGKLLQDGEMGEGGVGGGVGDTVHTKQKC